MLMLPIKSKICSSRANKLLCVYGIVIQYSHWAFRDKKSGQNQIRQRTYGEVTLPLNSAHTKVGAGD